jgi:hypothetical protein
MPLRRHFYNFFLNYIFLFGRFRTSYTDAISSQTFKLHIPIRPLQNILQATRMTHHHKTLNYIFLFGLFRILELLFRLPVFAPEFNDERAFPNAADNAEETSSGRRRSASKGSWAFTVINGSGGRPRSRSLPKGRVKGARVEVST